ncbi:MAG: PEGA domain-containing protein, partial [Candidatus Aminicenantes bacterium]|nr:PEGA domain-containing protein [Candidatus Aminicenantes bacterium]
MSANNKLKNKLSWAIGIGLFLFALSTAGAATKLKVISVRGADVYKEPMVGQPLTTFPLNAILEAETKSSEFWKVTFILKGVRTSGYVHEYMVTEVSESEIEGAASPAGPVKTQEQLAAEIQVKLDESRELIQQQKDLGKAVENLRSLIAKVFRLEDLQKQKQKACDIYLWTGHAFAKQGDDAAAVKEFRNMFEVDYRTAQDAAEKTSESSAAQLINIAEKQYKGVFEGYTLQIETDPKGAIIKIDGQTIGLSPNTHATVNPRITLEIEKEGYRPIKVLVPLKDPKSVLSYTLESLGRT